MKKTLIFSSIVTLALVGLYFLGQPKVVHPAMIGGTPISVEIADTDFLRERGLSGRESLGPEEGMLFVFPTEGLYQFWMKDMRFSIDIVWLDAEYRIADVHQRVNPETYPEIFTPKVKAQYVLELPAGFFENHQLKAGNILEIIK